MILQKMLLLLRSDLNKLLLVSSWHMKIVKYIPYLEEIIFKEN